MVPFAPTATTTFVHVLQKRQDQLIASPEEIAFAAGWITLSVLRPGWAAEGARAADVATRLGDVAGLAPTAP